ncbi:pyridoxal phosphate-dependent aminotransferase [Sphingobium sp. H39-3-25]|uniref:pyridoxal phosphate-dependent aminotransferase n=1 Tax=Sphingobium arseniciresistens TaxID=3030834 RepID=UPI0023B89EB9|nr:pyridoxal phosphate-dependent aminotransferase [Sphingobium arseniciresistens]
MDLPPFLLDHWLSRHDFADPPIAYNLASSTGPRWAVDELLALGDGLPPDMGGTILAYAPPEGSRALREAVARFLDTDPDWVVITAGASEALSILMCLLARDGANIVIPDPGYPAYAAMAQAWRLGTRLHRLDRAQDFAQTGAAVLAAMDAKTVGAIVNTPHNPTGSVMEPHDLARLASAMAERGAPLLVDEVYHPLYFGAPLPSAASTGIANLIVMGDMSKALSLPGLRMGWIVDGDAERRQRIIDARSYFTISSSPLLERIAAHALDHAGTIIARLATVANHNLPLLDDLISRTNGRLAWSQPRGGTTAYPWFSDGRDSRPFCEMLAKAGVLVAPGDCFGQPDHMRIGFTQQAEGFDIAIARMAQALAAL